jgi:NifB/MoaA-like Fe-S oxidoreductase
MTNQTVAEMWIQYRESVYPQGISITQFNETRQAFYAGAWALLHEFFRITGEPIPEAEMEKKFDKLLAEIQVFLQPKNKG